MAKLIFVLLLFLSNIAFNQSVRGIVRDVDTKEPLAFCSISVANKTEGTITNVDGEFVLKTNKDSLQVTVYYLGYYKLSLWLKKNILNNIYLRQRNYVLKSVTVNGYTNKKISKILIQLRNKFKPYKDEINEAKLITRTFTIKNNHTPIEINEIDYLAELSLSSINNLYVKSGKIGFNNNIKTGFYSIDIATVFLKNIDLFNQKKDIYNLNLPLSYNFTQDIEHNFNLSYNDVDEHFSVISFVSKDSLNNGQIFFDKNNLELKKIIVNTTKQKDLFYSINKNSTITNTQLHIEISFKSHKEKQVVDFMYLKFVSKFNHKNNNTCDTIETNFIADFYDYGKTFFKPFYGIEREFNDYEGVVITGYKKNLKHKAYISRTKKEKAFFDKILKNTKTKKIQPFKYISIEEINDSINIKWALLSNNSINKFKITPFVYCDFYKNDQNAYTFDTKAFIDYQTSYFTYKKDKNAEKFIKGILKIAKTNSDILNEHFLKKYKNKYVPYFKIRKELAKTYKTIEYEKQKYIKTNIDKLTKYPTKSQPQ